VLLAEYWAIARHGPGATIAPTKSGTLGAPEGSAPRTEYWRMGMEWPDGRSGAAPIIDKGEKLYAL
jgi:hypothetical protein